MSGGLVEFCLIVIGLCNLAMMGMRANEWLSGGEHCSKCCPHCDYEEDE